MSATTSTSTSSSFYSSPEHFNLPLLSSRNSVLLLPSSSSVSFTRKYRFRYRHDVGSGRIFRSPHRISIPANRKSASLIYMEWQDCTVTMEIDVPTSIAYNCYSDRQSIPRWMPFISSVKLLDDKPHLSRWSLKYKAFGQDIEYSWLARNMQPIPNQKIHWRSLEGLPNRGAVRFYPKGASSCMVELTVSYEVPQLLVPVASALKPFLESLLVRGLERFAKFAKEYSPESTM